LLFIGVSMIFSVFLVFISFFQIFILAARIPILVPDYTTFDASKDFSLATIDLINSSKDIQREMKDLWDSLLGCQIQMNKFIQSIGGQGKFEEHLEREKAEIGDETQHKIRCNYPFEIF
jgi:hypothetical protein